jgi:hypothetical protein
MVNGLIQIAAMGPFTRHGQIMEQLRALRCTSLSWEIISRERAKSFVDLKPIGFSGVRLIKIDVRALRATRLKNATRASVPFAEPTLGMQRGRLQRHPSELEMAACGLNDTGWPSGPRFEHEAHAPGSASKFGQVAANR